MTSHGPDDRSGSQDAWTAALGEVLDPTKPVVGAPLPYVRRHRRGLRRLRNLLVALIVLGAISGGIYVALKKGNGASKDAGASVTVSTPPPPTFSATTSRGPAVVANTATAHSEQLSQALTAVTT